MTTRTKKAIWSVVIFAAFVLGISALAHWIGNNEERLEREHVGLFIGYADGPESPTVIMVSYVPGLIREIAQDESIQRMLLPRGTAKGPAPGPAIEFLVTPEFKANLTKLHKSVLVDEWVDDAYFSKLNRNREDFMFWDYNGESVTLMNTKHLFRHNSATSLEKWKKRISIEEFKRQYPEQIILRETDRDAKERPGEVHIIGERVVFGRPRVNFGQFKNMLTADGVVIGITERDYSVEIHVTPMAIERLVSRALSLKSYQWETPTTPTTSAVE